MSKWGVRLFNRGAAKIAKKFYTRVASEEGERTVYDISVVGSNHFRDQVTESINLLQRQYPFGFSLLRRYIRAIVAFSKPIDFGFVGGFSFELPNTDGGLRWTTDRFAALLVRTAILARMSRYDLWTFRNARVQVVAWKAELQCMRSLRCHPAYVKQQEDFIKAKVEKEKRDRQSRLGIRKGIR